MNYPTPRLLYSGVTVTATANSGLVAIPQAPGYMFILDAAAGTGTSPTADVAIQVTPDDATFYTVARFAQLTTAAVKSFKMIRNGLALGEAAFVQAIADTGGAVDKNFVVTRNIRILVTVGGTNPSYATLKVYVVPVSLSINLG